MFNERAAWRLKQIADAALLGIADYVIIDLPTMNAVQPYMLGGSRIGDTVALHGEDPSGSAIRVLPHTAFADLPAGSIAILYNQDSLPEIDPGAARAYLRDACRLEIPLLLSINQEAHLPAGEGHQESVAELAAETGGFALLSRHRHWLRQGYVEETYERR